MINICFIKNRKAIVGFELSGHSGYDEEGSDIVCSAVSSAAYMTANTVTDVLFLKADLNVSDGYMMMKLSSRNARKAQKILRGFELHLIELFKAYPNNISVIYSEV